MTSTRYKTLKGDVQTLLSTGVGPLLADLTDGRAPRAARTIMGHDLSKYFDTYKKLLSRLDAEVLDCAILALAKSGKSTLLNAFLGASVLPSNNVPETARIVAITHAHLSQDEKPALLSGVRSEPVAQGEALIRAHLEFLNREVRTRRHQKSDEEVLTLRIKIAALERELDTMPVGLRLLDTPGPNEAGEEALKQQVERLLDSVDAIVYVLDYTKLKTAEEAALLAKLKQINPQLVRRLAQRLFFVVNKVDVMHDASGLDEDETKAYVADLITATLDNPDFQLQPEQVMLVSAQEALLSRLILCSKASAADKMRFARKAWGRFDTQKHTGREYMDRAREMLEASHLPALESRMLSYLYNDAGSLKLTATLDDVQRLLVEVKNVANMGRAALQQSQAQLLVESAELRATVDSTLENFQSFQMHASIFRDDLLGNIRTRMTNLRERLVAHTTEVLDTAREPTLPAVKAGPWRKVWEKVSKLWPFGSSGDTSSARLRELLKELHADITAQVEAEVKEFWGELEVSLNEQQADMLERLNAHLARLARHIEGVVGSVLELCLEPVDLNMQPPTAQEFHESLQKLFQDGISERTEVEEVTREEEYTEWVRQRGGICNLSEHYVARPARRRVAENVETTTYELSPEGIQEHFAGLISSCVNNSARWAGLYVEKHLQAHIDEARARLHSYADKYTATMDAALRAKNQSSEEQQASIAMLEAHLATINALLKRVHEVTQQSTQLARDVHETEYSWVPEIESEMVNEKGEEEDAQKLGSAADDREAVLDSAQEMATLALQAPKEQKGSGDHTVQDVDVAETDAAVPPAEANKEVERVGVATQTAPKDPVHDTQPHAEGVAQPSAVRATESSEPEAVQDTNDETSQIDHSIHPNEKAVQADMPDAAQRPTEPAAEAEEVSAAEPAFGALPGDPPVPEDAEIYRFLDEIRRAGPPPLSRTGSSSLTDALGVLSGSTTASPAVVPEQPWQSAVLPTSNAGRGGSHNTSEGVAEDLRESAILRAESGESDWEHLEKDPM